MSTRTFLQLELWATRPFSLVNSYFSLVNSYFSLVNSYFLKKILTICFVTLLWQFLCLKSANPFPDLFLRAADCHPIKITEPLYDETNENNYARIEDSDQTGRIRVLAVRSIGSK